MLRKIRIVAATLCFTIITLLFLDFTGTIHSWFGWLAKIQLLPAILALNVGVVAALIILTLLLGRVYCSVICPLGVMQDLISWAAGKRKKNRFTYSPANTWLRYGVLAVFIATLVAGFGAIALLVAPYSAYGRIAQNLLAPLWGWGNNLLAYVAERVDSYAFYSTEVVMGSIGTFAVAVATLIIVGVLAWRGGRTYCNTICPVGTVLGAISRFSFLKPIIDTDKCIDCKRCARNCKASCIDVQTHLTILVVWLVWIAWRCVVKTPYVTLAALHSPRVQMSIQQSAKPRILHAATSLLELVYWLHRPQRLRR